MFVFFGTGTMMADFRHLGTLACARDRLKIFINTRANCPAQSISTCPGTSSGPAAFRGLILHNVRCTLCVLSVRVC